MGTHSAVFLTKYQQVLMYTGKSYSTVNCEYKTTLMKDSC